MHLELVHMSGLREACLLHRLKQQFSQMSFAQIIHFSAVGVCATGIYFALAMVLIGSGVKIFVAHSIAYVVSLLASYFGQKVLTFGVRGEHKRFGYRFILATIVMASIQFGLVAILTCSGAADMVTVVASTINYPIASFLVHTFWTFKKPAKQSVP